MILDGIFKIDEGQGEAGGSAESKWEKIKKILEAQPCENPHCPSNREGFDPETAESNRIYHPKEYRSLEDDGDACNYCGNRTDRDNDPHRLTIHRMYRKL